MAFTKVTTKKNRVNDRGLPEIRGANKAQRLMKAERIVIGAKSYNLYPDRPS